MLTEEALVFLGILVAVGLLVLGILELLAPTSRAGPRRRFVSRHDPWRRARVGPAPARPRESAPAAASAPTRPSALSPPARPTPVGAAGLERLATPQPAEVRPQPVEPRAEAPPPEASPMADRRTEVPEREAHLLEPGPTLPAEVAVATESGAPGGLPAVEAEPTGGEPRTPATAVERCQALFDAGQFLEVLDEGLAALQREDLEPAERAGLWGVVGLARRELGDFEGAENALREALRQGSGEGRARWEQELGALALAAARELLARAEAPPSAEGTERIRDLRAALAWLERGLAMLPGDTALSEAAAAARAALWPTYEEVTLELIGRQDYAAARGLLREALGDPACPGDLATTFRELLSGTYSGEVGQLTAEALRRMQEGREAEALATLEQAEELLAATPEDGLSERRRQELERRLWWSYTKVGMRRLESGQGEDAVMPLLRALRFESVGDERLEETRRPLVRALEQWLEVGCAQVATLAARGEDAQARVRWEEMRTVLAEARVRGLNPGAVADLERRLDALQETFSPPP